LTLPDGGVRDETSDLGQGVRKPVERVMAVAAAKTNFEDLQLFADLSVGEPVEDENRSQMDHLYRYVRALSNLDQTHAVRFQPGSDLRHGNDILLVV
jgi:hypothetical protein